MANMIPISTVTVGSGGASSIAFSNIPQNYTDLLIKFSGRDSRGAPATNLFITLNGSSSNFSSRLFYSGGTTTYSGTDTSGFIGENNGSTATANAFSNGEIYISNYTSSNYKSMSSDSVTESNSSTNGDAFIMLIAALWSNTSPITSLTITPTPNTFSQYSSATLYGIRKY
jgi:hypothetical protein